VIIWGREQYELATSFCWLLHWLTLLPSRRRRFFPPKRRTICQLHCVAPQKTELYIVTSVRTSDATKWGNVREISSSVPLAPIWSTQHPWNASLQFLNLRQSVGLLGQGIISPQCRYRTQTQNKHRHRCLELNSNPRPQCLSSSLRPSGHCDRPEKFNVDTNCT
jgi:hypothetical protein